MNQTFFDLIVHWERVIGLHVGRNQDLSGVLQHLKNEKKLNIPIINFTLCCGSYYGNAGGKYIF